MRIVSKIIAGGAWGDKLSAMEERCLSVPKKLNKAYGVRARAVRFAGITRIALRLEE